MSQLNVDAINDSSGGNTATFNGSVLLPTSQIRLDTGVAAHGSTNTHIRRFANVTTTTGSAITYADSAADAASFTINEAGVYGISYTDLSSAAGTRWGLSLNSVSLTTALISINVADRLCLCEPTSGLYQTVAWIGRLAQNDVIRPHVSSATHPNGTNVGTCFSITQIIRT